MVISTTCSGFAPTFSDIAARALSIPSAVSRFPETASVIFSVPEDTTFSAASEATSLSSVTFEQPLSAEAAIAAAVSVMPKRVNLISSLILFCCRVGNSVPPRARYRSQLR